MVFFVFSGDARLSFIFGFLSVLFCFRRRSWWRNLFGPFARIRACGARDPIGSGSILCRVLNSRA